VSGLLVARRSFFRYTTCVELIADFCWALSALSLVLCRIIAEWRTVPALV
jgi:hypothetical protein